MAKPINFNHRGTEYIATVENQFRLNGRPTDEYAVRADIRGETGEHVYIVEAYVRVPRRLTLAQRLAVIVEAMDKDDEDDVTS